LHVLLGGVTYELGEGHRGYAAIEFAHAEDVERLQGLGAPDANVRLRLAIPSCLLSGGHQLSGGMHIHAGRSGCLLNGKFIF